VSKQYIILREMEIEKKGVKDSMEMVEKEVSSSKKMNHHRRGGIRTLPFILGKISHIYNSFF
jgi:hypothetical protein